VPFGLLADRIGRVPVFVGGHLLLLLVYATLLAAPAGTIEIFVCIALIGAYYAATDGVLMALGSSILPPELRSTGLAMLATAAGLARLWSSVLFGLLWTSWSAEFALLVFLCGLAVVIAATMIFARPGPWRADG
jgi:MFS family permease